MKHEQLISNLGSVKAEVRGIVDNIRAVRGDKHAALTLAFLHASTLTDVAKILAQHSDFPDELLERLRDIYLHCLAEMIRSFTTVAGLTMDEVDAAITEANAVEGSAQSMAQTAWAMAENGRSYGGSD